MSARVRAGSRLSVRKRGLYETCDWEEGLDALCAVSADADGVTWENMEIKKYLRDFMGKRVKQPERWSPAHRLVGILWRAAIGSQDVGHANRGKAATVGVHRAGSGVSPAESPMKSRRQTVIDLPGALGH
jgi:hypothetical protein